MKKICIIPALEKNIYSSNGDLVSWGDSTLLEWKISQAKATGIFDNIYVSTPSKKIIKIAKKNNVNFILRKNNLSLAKLYASTELKFQNNQLTWLSPTFPFISPKIIKNCIRKFDNISTSYDSCFASINKFEYFFYKKKELNFNLKQKIISRRKLIPLVKLVPGLFVKNSNINFYKNTYGQRPFFFDIDWFSSLEINTPSDIDIFNLLIKEYFKKNFK